MRPVRRLCSFRHRAAKVILSTPELDATAVDPLSVQFGPAGAYECHGQGYLEDADLDGDIDLMLHFRVAESGIACGGTTVQLVGLTYEGDAIQGTDAIEVLGCSGG